MGISPEQLAQHAADCWVAVHGAVFDLSSFAHPGGRAVIRRLAGTDASASFSAVHHRSLLSTLSSLRLGPLSPAPQPLAAHPAELSSPFPHARWEQSGQLAGRFIRCDAPLLRPAVQPTPAADDDHGLFRHRSGLRVLEAERDWLHLAEPVTYAKEMRIRRKLLLSHPKAVYRADRESLPAGRKVLGKVLAWLSRFAPDRFEIADEAVSTLTPGYRHRHVRSDYRGTPLLLVALLVQEDLFVMRKQAGDWVLAAGVACYSFDLPQKHLKSMLAIHHPHVPGFQRQLHWPISRFFGSIGTATFWRHNWQLTAYADLVHHDLPFAGTVLESIHPSPPFSQDDIQTNKDVEDLHWRVEYQTIQQLAESKGSILFTVRTYVDRIGGWKGQGRMAAFAAAAAIRRKHKGMLHYIGAGRECTLRRLLGFLDSLESGVGNNTCTSKGGECHIEPWARGVLDDGTWAAEAEQREHAGRVKDTSHNRASKL